jgi:protein-disulfide isomerase-like protein with CxxC motif
MADDLDVLLLAELRFARLDFEEGKDEKRSRSSTELAHVTGASESFVRARLQALALADQVFEDRLRGRWTLAGVP